MVDMLGEGRDEMSAATRSAPLVRFRARVVLLLLIVAIGTPVWGSVAPEVAAAEVLTVRRFTTDEKVMALTFDAGADRGYAAEILNILRDAGIKASFGMTGKWAEANPDLIRRMANEGHQFINHSWNHPSFPTISSTQRADELRRTDEIIRSIAGVGTQPYFRPPYGEYDDATLRDLAANGYTVNVMWTSDSMGWAGWSVSAITNKVVSEAVPGGNVLFHVGAQSLDAAALPGIISQLRAQGYRFQTVRDFIEPSERFFPETGFTVSGNFLRYWNAFGGLPVFGYPISEVFERNGIQMQYFERVRMELHPGSWPARYDVLLGRLGAELTAGRQNEPAFRWRTGSSNSSCTFYTESGHYLCSGFRDYWQRRGGLEIFGFPISEEFTENGYTVQYFERARFEWHPENAGTPYVVLGGHLGRKMMEQDQATVAGR